MGVCDVEFVLLFCVKQKTAYEMRISDWSSDVCSSDLRGLAEAIEDDVGALGGQRLGNARSDAAGRAGDQGGLSFQHGSHPVIKDPLESPALYKRVATAWVSRGQAAATRLQPR